MENGFPILMLCLSGGLLLYAGLLALTKDPELIMRHWAAKMKDGKAYAAQFAKVIAVVAAAPAASGLTGLLAGLKWSAVVLIAGLIICIYIGTRLMRKVM